MTRLMADEPARPPGPGDGEPSEQQRWESIVAELRQDPALRAPMPEPAQPDPMIDELLDDGEFVPQEPPPLQLPRTRLARFGWAGVIGGPVLALASRVLSLPPILTTMGVLAGIAGFVLLVTRLPDRRPEDDGDGAVV